MRAEEMAAVLYPAEGLRPKAREKAGRQISQRGYWTDAGLQGRRQGCGTKGMGLSTQQTLCTHKRSITSTFPGCYKQTVSPGVADKVRPEKWVLV